MKSSLIALVVLTCSCSITLRSEQDTGLDAGENSLGTSAGLSGCHGRPYGPDVHAVCVYEPYEMTYAPDGGIIGLTGAIPYNYGDGDFHDKQIELPEPCRNNATCACLQANSVSVCTIPGTACEDHPNDPSWPIVCGCTGPCCIKTPDGYSRWTCACKNLDGSPWCLDARYPQVCEDTPQGAVCNEPDAGPTQPVPLGMLIDDGSCPDLSALSASHKVCVYEPYEMTYAPDGGLFGFTGDISEVSEAPTGLMHSRTLSVPEPCWSNTSCACLRDNGIDVCPIAGTACEDHPDNAYYPLVCGCSGDCCVQFPSGYSRWTCACKNLDGSSWCHDTQFSQICIDDSLNGADCAMKPLDAD